MKKFALAGVLILGMVAPSVAADMPAVLKAPPQVIASSWSGFYLGAHAGYGWGRKDWVQTFSNQGLDLDRTESKLNLAGFLGGAQIGWNYRSGAWVLGVEGDWSWTNASDCRPLVIFTDYTNCTKAQWYATATGRVGRVWSNALLYLKGGLALVREKHFANFLGVIDTEETRDLRAGWVAGAGVEYAFAANWSWKIEYNYLDFGTRNVTLTYLPGGTSPGLVENWDVPQRVQIVKLGVNYHFAPLR